MSSVRSTSSDVGFVPVRWALPCSGTNGYVSSWGAVLSGLCPGLEVTGNISS